MTKRWKLKTNSSNILLVLITLILVKAEWVKGDIDNVWESSRVTDNPGDNNEVEETHAYVGNNEIADYFFQSSVKNNSFILEGVNNCLNNFQLLTCVKMLLLTRINDALNFMEDPNVVEKDVNVLNGLLKFQYKNNTFSIDRSEKEDLTLDEEIQEKIKRIFQKRSLVVNLLPKYAIEIEPVFKQQRDDFICFKYNIRKDSETNENENEGRKKKGGGMSMMMMVPQLIMLGLMPFTLASLKAMVMNAVMINMMALNGAIFMTIRNLVFGPRQGDNVKYVNYGYSKDRQTQSKKPVLIIHSPAAFVKQPPVHHKHVHGHSSSHVNYFPESHNYYTQNGGAHIEDFEENYYVIHQGENHLHGQHPDFERRNDTRHSINIDKINITIKPINKQNNNNYKHFRNSQRIIYKRPIKIISKKHH